uniref:Uncharacterized protein n=1 Tax=Arion vulgaris TaxID=1028688 RepID=A0A0B7BQU9_9EUPU
MSPWVINEEILALVNQHSHSGDIYTKGSVRQNQIMCLFYLAQRETVSHFMRTAALLR